MKIPTHLAIIMDGNRRWAKDNGKSGPTDGHRAGSQVLENMVEACIQRGIKYLTVYLFSTENFSRSAEELKGLFDLSVEFVEQKWKKLRENKVKVRIYGDLNRFPKLVNSAMNFLLEKTEMEDPKITLGLCFGYGGRQELVDACRRVVAKGYKVSDIDQKVIEDSLYMSGVPDVDLMIRTGGALRISNFLLWKIAYSELYFVDKYWPEFTALDLDLAIAEYNDRERRFGK